jgi:REP element-mobilizing transposase RayT
MGEMQCNIESLSSIIFEKSATSQADLWQGVVAMSVPRYIQLPDDSMSHVMFRCHDRNMFLKSDELKKNLLVLLAKYKQLYGIKIYEFILMDNHVHLFLHSPTASKLGHFMRTVLSQSARTINLSLQRDSQVYRERFKSKLVSSARYAVELVKYIYANRYVVDGKLPQFDFFCSAHWRIEQPYKRIENPTSKQDHTHNTLSKLLDDYPDGCLVEKMSCKDYLRGLVSQVLSNAKEQMESAFFRSKHTIGDKYVVAYRQELLDAYRRDRGPPILGVGTTASYPTSHA